MLDLCAGRLGWSKAFLARGWKVIAVDLVVPPEVPEGVTFYQDDIMDWSYGRIIDERVDYACASTPCEEFSVWGMKHFHPNPKWPTNGIRMFNHVASIFREADVWHTMENVRAAQQFVGRASAHAGSFYLWGAVPEILPRVSKGFRHVEMFAHDRTNRKHASATIPPELASTVCDYAERILCQTK